MESLILSVRALASSTRLPVTSIFNKSAEAGGNVEYLEKGGFGDSAAPNKQQILGALDEGR